MREEFATALRQAQDQDSPDARIDHIKRAVTVEVKAADPAVSVKFTDYFNHAVVPDMVLRWPQESRERLLFLRPEADPKWLRDDLDVLASHRPVIFTLQDIESRLEANAGQQTRALTARAAEADTWVAGPSAVQEVSVSRHDSSVIRLLGQALVRGGRGVATSESVRSLTHATEEAFSDAELLKSKRVASGVWSLERSLDAQQAGRFTRILRAVWEGNGGSGSTFPTVSTTGPLSDDDLYYLMTTLDDADPEFWSRVAKNVTTEQLGRLPLPDPSQSLQNLMALNLDALTAKGIRVTGQQVSLDEPEDFPRWVVHRGCLAIRGAEWIGHFAARKAEELPPPDAGKPMSLDTLRERLTGSTARVTRVDFGKGDRAVSYEARDRGNILGDEDLVKVADDVQAMSVERATLALVGGGTVNVEFADRTALGPTSSVLPVGGLARAALPLLVRLDDSEALTLKVFLASEDDIMRAAQAHEVTLPLQAQPPRDDPTTEA